MTRERADHLAADVTAPWGLDERHDLARAYIESTDLLRALHDVGTGKTRHRQFGECPDATYPHLRDPDCPVCAALARVDAAIGGGASIQMITVPPSATAPVKRVCNRHSDCDAADAQGAAESPQRKPYHCHTDDCEECFGC